MVSVLVCVLFVALTQLATWSADKYHQEVTQKLHRGLAQYVLEHLPGPLFHREGREWRVDKAVLKAIAMNTMMINPAVEVYLLNPEGRILGHALPEADIVSQRVELAPVKSFIAGQGTGPVFGSNPREPSQTTIFSATPVLREGHTVAYLYVVLASHQALNLAKQLQGSHVVRVSLAASAGLVLLFLLTAMFAFKRMTHPLRTLANAMHSYRELELVSERIVPDRDAADEVAALTQSFGLMKGRIREQFELLSESDRLRRDLVSNISHDLRTPLAAMQGYLETLLLKSSHIDAAQHKYYLEIAHRHSRQLGEMVAQLFELSKLDAGRIQPNLEVFSLSELLHDVKQDYELAAGEHCVEIEVRGPEEDLRVYADISLIHRVLQNLVDNALQHTPQGGRVVLEMACEDRTIQIRVTDSGSGIARHELGQVFERYYQAPRNATGGVSRGAGLGLNIVKKILALHDAIIEVDSPPSGGARFSFALPRP